MVSALALIRDNDIKKIDNSCNVFENLDKKNVLMNLDIIKSSNLKLYKAFCYQKSKNKESSRLEFFHIKQFPDGIYFSEDNGNYHCYIIELKYIGSNDLDKLTKQLFSGYIHCKTLLSVLEIDLNKVSYSFHVVYVKENRKQDEFNEKTNSIKFIPGKSINSSPTYNNWLKNKLVYTTKQYKKNMDIKKICLSNTELDGETTKYSNSLII
ncbi:MULTISPECIES: hypothetical protein [Bacillus]|nr:MULTISPECIES: hypothetical protein [Bacillus]QTV13654.1 hypothetical protein J9319_05965 [Bacillus altitudinis]